VSIVSTAHAGRRAGLTVSSMCSVCAEPPLLLVCVNADNEFCDLVDHGGRFAVNLLEQCHPELAMVFAGLSGDGLSSAPDGTDRFASGAWSTGANGAPVLDDALVSLQCSLESSLQRGTHRVFIGLVTAASTGSGLPLVYSDRGFVSIAPEGVAT